jgi:diguanylate cyclase (GGDEF)-like protein
MFPIPADEQERLAALHELEILDTPPEQPYDDLVQLAAATCRTPMATINFIDAERQWGKALVGLESSEAPREHSFCARTILEGDGLLVIPDTLRDPRWSGNPLVIGHPRVRFYAGAAILTEEGQALGALCVADDRGPRELDDRALDALRILARQASAHLTLRQRTMQLARANGELRRMAVRDALTGLANRIFLEDSLARALRRRLRTGAPLGVLFCDLDGFKAINERLGHQAGDRLLVAVSERLATAVRASDLVARFAGDEFVVMCPDVSDAEQLAIVAERLLQAVSRPFELDGESVTPAMSLGQAVALDGDRAEDLIGRADLAMYRERRARQRRHLDAQEDA